MPGLLQTPESKFGGVKFVTAVIAEFLGTLFFAFAGTTTPTGVTSTQQGVGTADAAAANWCAVLLTFLLLACACTRSHIAGNVQGPMG